MKAAIHPQFYTNTVIKCACGNTFVTGSTVSGEIHTEICSQCHPFYTGKQKLIDTTGTVERFKQRVAKAQAAQAQVKVKKPRKVRSDKK